MRLFRHCASLAALVLVSAAFSVDASAQQIRTYDDQANSSESEGESEGSSGEGAGAWYPGMPQPQRSDGDGGQAPQQQAQPGEEAPEGEEAAQEGAAPSHRISVFGQRGKQRQQEMPATLDMAIDQLYRGIIPGTRDEVAHLKEDDADASPIKLTWLGFRPTDEETRVFFQTSRKADFNLEEDRDANRLEIELSNADIASRNFSRYIDTRYFDRNVERVAAEKRGADTVVIVIELESFETPDIETDGKYVYLDFPFDAAADDGERVAGQDD